MKLDDGKAWFRRWMGIGFRPTTSEGRLLISAMAGIFLLAGVLMIYLDGRSPWTEAIGIIALGLVGTGYAVIYWKLEEPF